MADTKKKTKMWWSNLHSNKDGKVKDGKITVKAEGQTHIWMKEDEDAKGGSTAPFYFRKVTGDFEASVKVSSTMDCWLDGAGLLIQEKRGVYHKVGLEFHDDTHAPGNPKYFAAAYVHPEKELEMYSNLTPFPKQFKRKDKKYEYVQLDDGPKDKVKIWFKVVRKGRNIDAKYSRDGEEWIDLKESKFTYARTLSVGVFCAAGNGESKGVKAVFEDLKIEEDPDWEDKPIDFMAEAAEDAAVATGGDGKAAPAYVDFARKAAEDEEAMMMARLSALGMAVGGDAEAAAAAAGDALLVDASANSNFDAGAEMDFSAKMREMDALKSAIMTDDDEEAGAGEVGVKVVVSDDDDDDDDDDEPVKKTSILDDSDSDSD